MYANRLHFRGALHDTATPKEPGRFPLTKLTGFSEGLAVVGGAVGLWAAYFWLKASQVEVDPGWRSGPPQSAADARRPTESGDPLISQMAWTGALLEAATKSAALNKAAALLTAVAVVLGVASSLLGTFAR
jgi:hypothetical protein